MFSGRVGHNSFNFLSVEVAGKEIVFATRNGSLFVKGYSRNIVIALKRFYYTKATTDDMQVSVFQARPGRIAFAGAMLKDREHGAFKHVQ